MLDLEKLRGIVPPIITPLDDEEDVDRASLRRVVEWVLAGGVHGIWATGTTGEFPCLVEKQRAIAVEVAVEAAAGRVPVVASIGDSSTRLAIRHGLNARSAGADLVALTPPHYYVNAQEDLLTHYRVVREKVGLPVMIYNIPQNTKARLEISTVLTLVQEGTVVGIKDSYTEFAWFKQVVQGATATGRPFRAFLANYYLLDAALLVGGVGNITGPANVAPAVAVAGYEAAKRGDRDTLVRCQRQMAELTRRLGGVPGIKGALKVLGVIESPRMTLPFATIAPSDEARIRAILQEVGVAGQDGEE